MAGATVEMQSHEGDITVRVTTALSNREKEATWRILAVSKC